MLIIKVLGSFCYIAKALYDHVGVDVREKKFSLFLICVSSCYSACFLLFYVFVLYGPLCHVALKLGLSTFKIVCSLNISSIYITLNGLYYKYLWQLFCLRLSAFWHFFSYFSYVFESRPQNGIWTKFSQSIPVLL